jgi:hypothetical protein
MRSPVHDQVAIRGTIALVANLVKNLGVHRRADPGMHVLTCGFAHPAEHALQHLLREIAVVELSVQLRHPEIKTIGHEPGGGQGELVAKPAAGASPPLHTHPRGGFSAQ